MVWCLAAELADVVTAVEAPCPDVRARLVHDDMLDATVVHLEADLPVGRAFDEMLRRLVAVVGAHEAVLSFGTAPIGPIPNDRTGTPP